jgi:hypothetical protein
MFCIITSKKLHYSVFGEAHVCKKNREIPNPSQIKRSSILFSGSFASFPIQELFILGETIFIHQGCCNADGVFS